MNISWYSSQLLTINDTNNGDITRSGITNPTTWEMICFICFAHVVKTKWSLLFVYVGHRWNQHIECYLNVVAQGIRVSNPDSGRAPGETPWLKNYKDVSNQEALCVALVLRVFTDMVTNARNEKWSLLGGLQCRDSTNYGRTSPYKSWKNEETTCEPCDVHLLNLLIMASFTWSLERPGPATIIASQWVAAMTQFMECHGLPLLRIVVS